MAQLALGLQPGEHPVHHAEQQHRQRLVQARARELGADRGDRVGEGGDDAALAAEDALLLGRLEEAHVLGQDAVLGLRAGVGGEEGVDQAAQARSGASLAASTSATSASSRATCASAISASSWCLSRT